MSEPRIGRYCKVSYSQRQDRQDKKVQESEHGQGSGSKSGVIFNRVILEAELEAEVL